MTSRTTGTRTRSQSRAKRTSAAASSNGQSAAAWIPPRPTLPKAREASKKCKGCDLWKLGTQTVFGEGARTAKVMFVGEQPGDQEDRAGKPFVGPAGRVLDEALDEAGIDRSETYVTNAVKHFKWTRGEKSARRIHRKPNDAEIRACRPWLDVEIGLVQPRVLVALGATAAQALLGKQFRVTRDRGKAIRSELAPVVMATVHPSSVLRAPESQRARARRDFTADIRKIAALIDGA